MNGLLVEEGDVSGGIAQFVTDNGYCGVVMTQYADHPIYIQRLQAMLRLRDNKLEISRVHIDGSPAEELAIIDLSEPDSLDKLLGLLSKWATLRRKARWGL